MILIHSFTFNLIIVGIFLVVWELRCRHLWQLFFIITLQNTTAASVLHMVANNPGPITAAGFTEPYWLR